jgi:hypothetical protein
VDEVETTERTWGQDVASVLNSFSVNPAVGLDSAVEQVTSAIDAKRQFEHPQ